MKKHLTVISAIADLLESDSYHFYETNTISGEDVLLTNCYEINGKKVEKEKTYQISVPVINQVNHKRRMKRAYEANGVDGIMNYIEKYVKPTDRNKLKELVNEYLK